MNSIFVFTLPLAAYRTPASRNRSATTCDHVGFGGSEKTPRLSLNSTDRLSATPEPRAPSSKATEKKLRTTSSPASAFPAFFLPTLDTEADAELSGGNCDALLNSDLPVPCENTPGAGELTARAWEAYSESQCRCLSRSRSVFVDSEKDSSTGGKLEQTSKRRTNPVQWDAVGVCRSLMQSALCNGWHTHYSFLCMSREALTSPAKQAPKSISHLSAEPSSAQLQPKLQFGHS